MREHTSKPVYLGTEIAAFCPKNFECQMLVSVLGTNINYSLYVKRKGIRTNLSGITAVLLVSLFMYLFSLETGKRYCSEVKGILSGSFLLTAPLISRYVLDSKKGGFMLLPGTLFPHSA